MKIQVYLILAITIFVSACSGGTIGGLVPAPKILDGSIDGDFYISKYNAFRVQLPHPPSKSSEDSYEWKYTEVHEIDEVGPDGSKRVVGAVFGPSAFDHNQYHAVLIRNQMKNPKEDFAKSVFANKVKFANNILKSDKSKGGEFKQRHSEIFNLNGRTVYYVVYESPSQYLVLSLTDNGNSFFAIEANVMYSSTGRKKSLSELTSRSWDKFNAMLKSFTVLREEI